MLLNRSVLLSPSLWDECTNAVSPSKAEQPDNGAQQGSEELLNMDNPAEDLGDDGPLDGSVILPGIVNVTLHHGTELCLWRRTDAQGRTYYAIRTLFWK